MCFFQKKEKKISFEKSFLRYLFLLKNNLSRNYINYYCYTVHSLIMRRKNDY